MVKQERKQPESEYASTASSYTVERVGWHPTQGAGDWYRLALHYQTVRYGKRLVRRQGWFADRDALQKYVERYHSGLREEKPE